MRPRGWLAGCPQITLSSVKLSLSLSQMDCFRAAWNEALLQSLNTLYACNEYLRFVRN